MNASFRTAAPDALATALSDARQHTLALFDRFAAVGLDDPANVPLLPIVNPPLWELGHIAWFAEWYILREARSSAPDAAQKPSVLAGADACFDSNTVSHDARWTLRMPAAEQVGAYCREVLDRVLEKLTRADATDDALYPFRLILAHEDMHGEAFAYTLQTLGIAPAPDLLRQSVAPGTGAIDVAGGTVELGSRPGAGFVFDNEKWAHRCEVAPFSIDAAAVSNTQYAAFVEDGGYRTMRYWTPDGREWLAQQERAAPRDWVHDGRQWQCRRFGTQIALPDDEPVRHVTLYEAQAYCSWAGRRLPAEAEWVHAARSGHPAFRWGDVWEWTGSRFTPFQGFSADAYREYSAPYFGTHQTTRGASFATPLRLRSIRFRNFYAPQRDDIFVGFRTCAL